MDCCAGEDRAHYERDDIAVARSSWAWERGVSRTNIRKALFLKGLSCSSIRPIYPVTSNIWLRFTPTINPHVLCLITRRVWEIKRIANKASYKAFPGRGGM